MSFVYGGVRSDDLAGVIATLREWPSLDGLSPETIDRAGRNGRFYAGYSHARTRFVFDVIIEGANPAEVFARLDNFVGLVDPARGPRALAVEMDSKWVWPDVVAADAIKWDRMAWDRGLEAFALRGDVTFETTDDALAREATPTVVTFAGSTQYTHNVGNTTAYPRIVFDATSSKGGAPWVVKIGNFKVSIEPGFASGEHVDLDWNDFEFRRTSATGKRLGSVVRKMSNYDRPELHPGEQVAISVSGPPAGNVLFYPNGRRK